MSLFRRQHKEELEKEIYYKYAEKMYLLCLRYVNDNFDAEEILHNGFMKVFKNIDSFKENFPGSMQAWIKKIMINESLMFLRKKNKNIFIELDKAINITDVEETASSTIDSEYLIRLLHELPSGYRTVFNLSAIEGYDHGEIARMLNISESTSRSQLMKARKMLQQKLKIKDTVYERYN